MMNSITSIKKLTFGGKQKILYSFRFKLQSSFSVNAQKYRTDGLSGYRMKRNKKHCTMLVSLPLSYSIRLE